MKKRIPVAAGLAAALVFSYFAIEAVNRQLLTDTFNRIYAEGTWGKNVAGKGTSGTGSTLAITREYRAYVEDFIKKHRVKSVVDAGCGDWSFSSAIDWGDASYLGVDIASDVIAAVRNRHEKDKIKFQVRCENRDVASGGYRAIDLAATPFEVRGLVDLPIKFGDETSKITSLLRLTQQPYRATSRFHVTRQIATKFEIVSA
jgi:hypothetical protein